MKTVIFSVVLMLVGVAAASAQSAIVTPADLNTINGQKWTGTLTYLDYRSNKKVAIKSNLTVKASAERPDAWSFDYEYPDEPKANGSSIIELKDGGRNLNDQTVGERTVTADGGLRIVTTKKGTDNDKSAMFRYTYTISQKSFSIRKDVQLEGSTEWFERNEYSWTR